MPLSQTSQLDGLGAEIVAGEGTAGVPTGGIVTVQGVTGGLPVATTSITALTPGTPTSVTSGLTSSVLVAANTARKGLVITNLSANHISLNLLNGTATLSAGITLYPGWIWQMDNFTFTTNGITVVASAAGSTVSVQEFS